MLGPELARGGEGAVYTIPASPNELAKVYFNPPDANKAAKLVAMIATEPGAMAKVSAWPTDVLFDRAGSVRGFAMPRMGSRADAHQLYSPKSRASTFPDADFRFITHVAGNVARAFATVHAAGHVIGDINHGHILVGPDGRSVLIDIDSIQVTIAGKTYSCDVGTPLFLGPELQGRPLKGVVRTIENDGFGLAVLLFHLLFMGRHPFAGVWSGSGDMPIEKAISEGRFAYSASAASFGMKRPPGSVALPTFGPVIAEQFERAFRSQRRPPAAEWVKSLEVLNSSLKPCSLTISHQYPSALSSCPWCEIEAATGARLFGHRLSATAATGTLDVAALWRAIELVQPPPKAPPIPSDQPWRPPAGVTLPSRMPKLLRTGASVVLAAGGVAGCAAVHDPSGLWITVIGGVVAAVVWPRAATDKVRKADQSLAAAHSAWDALRTRWANEAADNAFSTARKQLEAAKSQLTDLPNERTRRLNKLKAEQESYQRRKHLDRFRIDRASIPGIGAGRAATLAGFGIETAFDVDTWRIRNIHGFGPKLCSELTAWRARHEATFRFNPSAPIDRGEIRRVEGEIAAIQQRCMSQLTSGANRLRQLRQEMLAARTRLAPLMKQAWDRVKIAEAERRAL